MAPSTLLPPEFEKTNRKESALQKLADRRGYSGNLEASVGRTEFHQNLWQVLLEHVVGGATVPVSPIPECS